ADQPVQILRFANRVPLLFQQGACAITNAVQSIDWRRYGLDQKGGTGIPSGPGLILVHLASTQIPFTSEAKEAVAEDPELDRELVLALQAAARHLKTHLSRRARRDFASEKFAIIQRILPKLAQKASGLVDKPVPDLTPVVTRIMDVVHVDTTGADEAQGPRITSTITNYTPRVRVLELFLEMPAESFPLSTFIPAPEGTDRELGRAWWTLPRLEPSGRTEVTAAFPPGAEVDAGDVSWYVAGVDEGHLLGAEPLPGDWDVRLPRAVIEAARESGEPLPPTESDEEVDYDAAESSAHITDDE
ncbi:MAG: DNA topoisomerase VI subunit B, partial [Thermoplasmata archaeon]